MHRNHILLPRVILVICVILVVATTRSFAAELKFAVSLPLSSTDDGRSARAVAAYLDVYVSIVNAELAIPNGHNLSITTLDSSGSLARAVGNVFQAKSRRALGIIGDLSSDHTIPMALAAQQQGMYMCSGSATATKLSNTGQFPGFFRTVPSDVIQGAVLARFIKHMQWSSCIVLASSSQYGRSVSRAFLQSAQEVGVGVAVAEHIPFRGSSRDQDAVMARALRLATESGIRIFVFLGTDAEYLHLARVARATGLVGSEAVWIGSEGLAPLSTAAESDAEIKALTQGLLYVFPREAAADNAQVRALVERVQLKLESAPSTSMAPYAAAFCDCLLAMTTMFVDNLKSTPGLIVPPGNASDATAIPANLGSLVPAAQLLQPFQGLTGRVDFNAENSRDAPFVVYNVFDGSTTAVFTIDTAASTVEALAKPRYYSGATRKPLERPSSVISFVQYFSPGGWVVLVATGLFALTIVVCALLMVVHRQTVYVREHSLSVLLLVALGLFLFVSTPLAWLDQQSFLTCNAGIWASAVGMQLIVLPLLYRTFQTWRACENVMLWKRPLSNSFVTLVVAITLFLIECVYLFSWTYLAPLAPTALSNATSFSYVCRSGKSAVAHHLLMAAHAAWDFALIGSLVFFTSATRWLRTPARSQHYTHFVGINLILCSGVGMVATVLHFASFALATFWIYTLLVWYVVSFTLAMLHVCVLQQLRNPADPSLVQDASDPLYSLLAQRYGRLSSNPSDASLLKSFQYMTGAFGLPVNVLASAALMPASITLPPFVAGVGSSGPTATANVDGMFVTLPGKPTTVIGDFAIKFPRVFSTWTLHRMIIAMDEGYLCVMKKVGGVDEQDVGRIWRLGELSARLVPYMELVLEVRSMGEPIMFVQLNVEDQLEELLHLMPDHQGSSDIGAQ